jgi:hypothetical protein
LRKPVELSAIPERATIYLNSVGFFQLFINGKRVGADQFTPHVSQPDKRSFCLTYDVTDYLTEGKNTIGLWLGQGWSGVTDIHGSPRLPSPAVRAQLEMAIADAGQYRFKVSNDMAGKDPAPGTKRQLVLDYELNGDRSQCCQFEVRLFSKSCSYSVMKMLSCRTATFCSASVLFSVQIRAWLR